MAAGFEPNLFAFRLTSVRDESALDGSRMVAEAGNPGRLHGHFKTIIGDLP
jgi:hypothetical protein